MTAHYGVIGNPVAHSKSPWIHAEFAQQTHQDIQYSAELCPLNDFSAFAKSFFARGALGCNITVPFKEDAWRLAEVRSARAEKAGAINTLMKGKDGRLYGDNTDGVGLVRDLTKNAQRTLKNKKILIVGAGGAVRGVLAPLLAEQPAEIIIVNRTDEKARALADIFAHDGAVRALPLTQLAHDTFDLVINGTSASLRGELPALPATIFNPEALAYDMMYAAAPTAFCAWAKHNGAATRDGLGMLVEQAAEAFFVWRGVRPNTDPVLSALRQTLMATL